MAENEPIHLAIDLGASGGRVLAGRLTDTGIHLEEVHRFPNGGIPLGKRLVWNLLGQWEQVLEGLGMAAARYGDRIRSVGADTWGVDYVLLDRNDDQVGPCFHYRDARTRGIWERAFERLSRQEIFAATGLQFLEINTAVQLLAMRLEQSPLLDVADRFLMVPDYVHWQLTGEKVNEFTNSSTTQLLNPQTCQWSSQMLQAFELPAGLFSTPVQPGHSLGELTSTVRSRTQLHRGVELIVPATHDTGSAVLAVPASTFAQKQPGLVLHQLWDLVVDGGRAGGACSNRRVSAIQLYQRRWGARQRAVAEEYRRAVDRPAMPSPLEARGPRLELGSPHSDGREGTEHGFSHRHRRPAIRSSGRHAGGDWRVLPQDRTARPGQ